MAIYSLLLFESMIGAMSYVMGKPGQHDMGRW